MFLSTSSSDCDLNELSSPDIDIYDNAMFIIALDFMREMEPDNGKQERWQALRNRFAEAPPAYWQRR